MQTFFAQAFFVTQDEPEEGEALVWLGTKPCELLTPEAAIAIVEPHAIVPKDLAAKLLAQLRKTIEVKDGSHWAAAKRRLVGSIH